MSEELAKKAYSAYGQTTDFKNYQGLPMPEWENLPDTIKLAWQNAAAAAGASAIAEKERELSPVKCYWVVETGVVPGIPQPGFTKQFFMTVAEYVSDNSQDIFVSCLDKALEYARSLHSPQQLNWVNVRWVWC